MEISGFDFLLSQFIFHVISYRFSMFFPPLNLDFARGELVSSVQVQAGILDLVATPEHDHLGFETRLGCCVVHLNAL
jgi:hypothetical protein